MWCSDNSDLRGIREYNKCNSDEECLEAARKYCDSDLGCFGIAWYAPNMEVGLKLCRSNEMSDKNDGWHTIMKEGMHVIFITNSTNYYMYI